MIHESSYWKDDLLKLASRLERRLIQTRWDEKNFYTVEKEIFIGFYSIRIANRVKESIRSHLEKEIQYPRNSLSRKS